MFTKAIASILFVSFISLTASALDFKVDKVHSNVGFNVTHLLITEVEGQFNDYSINWSVNEKGELTSFDATTVAKSIDTDNQKRDDHLRNSDFFEVDKYPSLTFKTTKILKDKVVGQLTIRGVTKPVTFTLKKSPIIQNPFSKDKSAKKMGLKLTATIDRTDFNVGTSFASKTISKDVTIELKLQGDSVK